MGDKQIKGVMGGRLNGEFFGRDCFGHDHEIRMIGRPTLPFGFERGDIFRSGIDSESIRG